MCIFDNYFQFAISQWTIISSYLHLEHLITNKMDDDSDIVRKEGSS